MKRRQHVEDEEFTRTDVIERLLTSLNEQDFSPNDTAAFMARERDRTGETEWRSQSIDNYKTLGRRLELIEQLARANHEDVLFKASVGSFKRWAEAQDAKLNRWLGWICTGIAAISALYGAIIFVIFERVFK